MRGVEGSAFAPAAKHGFDKVDKVTFGIDGNKFNLPRVLELSETRFSLLPGCLIRRNSAGDISLTRRDVQGKKTREREFV